MIWRNHETRCVQQRRSTVGCFFLIWRRQDFSLSCGFAAPWGCCRVRLPTTQSAQRNHRQWQSRTLGTQLSPSQTGYEERFEHARTTPLTEAMLVTSCERDCKTLKDVFVCHADTVVREAVLVGGARRVVVRRNKSERVCEHVPCWVVQATKCSKWFKLGVSETTSR